MLSVILICVSIIIGTFILFFSLGIGICAEINADKKTAVIKVKVFGKITAVKFKFFLLDKSIYYRLNSRTLKKVSNKQDDAKHKENKAKNSSKTADSSIDELRLGDKLYVVKNALKSKVRINKCFIDVVSPVSPKNCMTLAVVSFLLQLLNNNSYIQFKDFSAITFSADTDLRIGVDLLFKWEIFKIAYIALKILFTLSRQVKKENKQKELKRKHAFHNNL